MISIFINEFTNLVHVYDGTELRKTFEYQDDSFLKEWNTFQIVYISKRDSSTDIFDNHYKKDWVSRFEKSIKVEGKLYLWFMSNDMCFVPLNNIDEAKTSYQLKQDTHVFVGGTVDGDCKHYTYNDFYQVLIQLYCHNNEEKECTDIRDSLLGITEQINALSNKVTSIIEELNNSNDKAEVESLKDELSKYRNDFYFKSVQRQGLDAMIEILESMCTLLYNSRSKGTEVTCAIEHGVELIKRALQKNFKIKFVTSSDGDVYNEERMVAYPTESIQTNDDQLSGHVAKSVSPAIYWTLPRINSSDVDFLYKEETVILYM